MIVLIHWLSSTPTAVMLFRVSSMYHHDIKFIWVLAVAFTLEVSTVFGFVSAGLLFRKSKSWVSHKDFASLTELNRAAATDAISVLGNVTCSPKSFPKWTFFALASVVGFEILIVSLSFRVAIRYYRSLDFGDGLRITPKGSTKLPFVFFRDSITFPLL